MPKVFISFLLDQLDNDFIDVFFVLDNEMKKKTMDGLGIVKSAMPVSVTTEDKLWKKCKLGKENGYQLIKTVMFLLGVNLGLRGGGNEHKRLRRSGFGPQVIVTQYSDGFKCLKFTEDPQSKTHQGGISSRVTPPNIIYAYPNYEQVDKCPVRLYEKYTRLLPESRKNGCLYMHAHKRPTTNVWYVDYPLGINHTTPIIKELVQSISITEVNYKNQSLRATMTTRMYDENQDEGLIQEFTGHRSTCVHRYKHASDALKCKASKRVQGAKKCFVSKLYKSKVSDKSSIFKKIEKNDVSKVKVNGDHSTDSNLDFMLSQSLHTFSDKSIEMAQKNQKEAPTAMK